MSTSRWGSFSLPNRAPRLPSVRTAALAMFATHGILDGALTALIVFSSRGTTLESNPVLSWYLYLLYKHVIGGATYLELYLALATLAAKIAVVGAVCWAVWRWLPDRRLFRAWVALLTLAGGVVVINNLVALV